MKLQKIFWALMVMALPLSFLACSSKDDDEIDDTPYTYQTPAQKGAAASYTTAENYQGKTQGVVFGEGGNCVIKQKALVGNKFRTRGGDEDPETGYIYIIGTYVKNGDTYEITVNGQAWGSVTVTQAQDAVVLVVKEYEGGNPQKFTEEQAPAKPETKMPDSSMSDLLCRTWKPFRTRLNFKKFTSESWIADELEGADFEKVKVRINRESTNPDDPIIKDGFGDGYTVTSVFFTQTGTFCIAFSNGKSYVGKWWWDGDPAQGNIKYEWLDEDMGCEYETGVAHVDIYTTGVYKGECWLRLLNDDIKVNGGERWQVQLVFRLNP